MIFGARSEKSRESLAVWELEIQQVLFHYVIADTGYQEGRGMLGAG